MERTKVKAILLICRNVDCEISLNKRMIRDIEETYYVANGKSTTESYISSRNLVSRPTEKAALNVPEHVSVSIEDLQQRNQNLLALRGAVLRELNTLPYIQKKVLYDFYINREFWDKIARDVNYSIEQCKRYRNQGLDVLGRKFDTNKKIKELLQKRGRDTP